MAIKTKYKTGRPSKYRPEYCEKVITLMREGLSKTEVCAELDISWDTLARWQKEIAEFSEAIKKGQKLSEAWWMRLGRENLYNKDFKHQLYYMNMKNRFGWCDRQESKVTGTCDIDIEQKNISQEIEKILNEAMSKVLSDK